MSMYRCIFLKHFVYLSVFLLTVGNFSKILALNPQDVSDKGVQIIEVDDKLQVKINGQLFTEYNYLNVIRPYFYPVIGPTGENITRHWPMKDGPNEEHDHPHHRSLWFTHGNLNGYDFWLERGDYGKIVHDKFIEISSDKKVGIIKSANKWITDDGKIVCTDTRVHKFYNTLDDNIIMDFDIHIHASHGKVTFGDTKEGTMAIRLAPAIRLKGKVGKGNIVNSEGLRDNDTWGKRAEWCDYYGPLNGEITGVAIFDHPGNPRHPTWWHVRNYGLFTANPFGVHDFELKPKGTGDLTIPEGKSMSFRYRFVFHKDDTEQANISELYSQYIKSNN